MSPVKPHTGSVPVVVGLGFGDEGKGSVVDALVRRLQATCVVRFGGGPQGAHHVVTGDGRLHTFSQLGSGTLVPGVETVLAREVMVEPFALVREIEALARLGVADAASRLVVDPRCRMVTPWHRLVGRMRERVRGDGRHGSRGRGVGEAARDAQLMAGQALCVGDLGEGVKLFRKLDLIARLKTDVGEQLAAERPGDPAQAEDLAALRRLDPAEVERGMRAAIPGQSIRVLPDEALGERLDRGERLVLEGAHGVLLDRRFGFDPHVTQTDTTTGPALRLFERLEAAHWLRKVGVLRAYQTRHGAGPLPTEDPALTAALPEGHNAPNEWQGAMRCGALDLVALRYAAGCCGGVDELALTCVDRLAGRSEVALALAYELAGGAVVERLAVPDPEDAGAVGRVTRQVNEARPVLRRLPGWEAVAGGELPRPLAAFVDLLESEEGLGRPVRIVSHGPTAAGKVFRDASPGA